MTEQQKVSREQLDDALSEYVRASDDLMCGMTVTGAKARFAEARADLDAMLDAVFGQLDAMRKDAWQPIETAPKDGSALLLMTKKGVCVIGKRNKHLHIWVDVEGRETPREIAYWQPYPAAPEVQP